MVREKSLNLNGLWDYAMAPADADRPDEFQGQILVPYPIESALSGVRKRVGADQRLWYRRTVEIPDDWDGQRVLLHFGAVDWEANVTVNGKDVGTHRGGYDAFSFDITDALKDAGPQEIVLRVFDPTSSGNQARGKQVNNPRGIWYTPTTGIWQTAWLEPVPPVSIQRLTLTPDVDDASLHVTVTARGETRGHTARVTAMADGQRVGQAVGAVGTDIRVPVPQPKLWSPDSPFLYDLEVQLLAGEDTVDIVRGYFGMRKVALGKDADGVTRILLNGEAVFQIGFLDQGFWPDGLYTAATDDALRHDIEVTKQLGMNMARKHVKIEPARWYYWADKLGLLVWQDMPNGNNKTAESKKQFEAELRALVEGRRNHPSIIMWVPFNEGWGQHDTARYVKMIKEMDPSRLVNNASGWTDKKVGDVHDIHKYPGPAAPPVEEDRAPVLGEFGGLGLGVDGHTWAKKHWGYRGMASREDLTERYVKLLRKLHALKVREGL
jgi:beta-galactosidase/beta-glucuronidase